MDEETEDRTGYVFHFHDLGFGFYEVAVEGVEEEGRVMLEKSLVDHEGRLVGGFVDLDRDEGLGFSGWY